MRIFLRTIGVTAFLAVAACSSPGDDELAKEQTPCDAMKDMGEAYAQCMEQLDNE